MSTNKKAKPEKIKEEGEEEVTKPEKKQKAKRKKREPADSQKHPDSKGVSKESRSLQQPEGAKPQTGSGSLQQPEGAKPQTASDPIGSQLSSLQHDGLLTANSHLCQLINSHLEQVTINLYQSMIMRSSLIKRAISLAKQSGLTPKEYFSLEYTNKLLLIRKLLSVSGANKYKEFAQMIDGEVHRVTAMMVRSLEEGNTYEQVLADLKKNNRDWEVKE